MFWGSQNDSQCSLKKNTFPNLRFGFLFTLGDPPPWFGKRPHFFRIFFGILPLTYFGQSNGQGPTIITITIIITNVIAIITVLIVIIIITENLIIARFHNNFPKAKKQLRLIRVLTLQVGPNVYIGDDDS